MSLLVKSRSIEYEMLLSYRSRSHWTHSHVSKDRPKRLSLDTLYCCIGVGEGAIPHLVSAIKSTKVGSEVPHTGRNRSTPQQCGKSPFMTQSIQRTHIRHNSHSFRCNKEHASVCCWSLILGKSSLANSDPEHLPKVRQTRDIRNLSIGVLPLLRGFSSTRILSCC